MSLSAWIFAQNRFPGLNMSTLFAHFACMKFLFKQSLKNSRKEWFSPHPPLSGGILYANGFLFIKKQVLVLSWFSTATNINLEVTH